MAVQVKSGIAAFLAASATMFISAPVQAATVVDVETSRHATPVGVWTTDIDFGGGQIVKVWQSFTRRGEHCHKAVGEGSLAYGKGTWRPTGRNTFVYSVDVRFYDANGVYGGGADMSGQATADGDVFRTLHHVRVYDVAGNVVDEGEDWLTLDRLSTRNPKCTENP